MTVVTGDALSDLFFQGWESTIHRFQDRKKKERGKEERKEIIYLDSTLFKYLVLSVKFPIMV